MTILSAYQQLLNDLSELYDQREAANIADWVMENITGKTRSARLIHKNELLDETQLETWKNYSRELLQYKPVQYVLNEAWFAGMKFFVNENVLIPRPETEELVEWIVKDVAACRIPVARMLDIGTGSGCISIALKKKIETADIHAADISPEALNVAKQNALALQTPVHFHQLDILNKAAWHQLASFDIIVSNPPYIKQSESENMHNNVLKHEPHVALFVPDEDALLFYRTIAAFGLEHLNKNGKLFFEINEALGSEVCLLLEQFGYTAIELRKDLQGKDRMVKAEPGFISRDKLNNS